MQVLRRAMSILGLAVIQEEDHNQTNYESLMNHALSRIRLAELQLKEATSLEELDIARSAMMSGWAEVQQLIRSAKRERGITVRPIAETEELHRNMRDFMNNRNVSSDTLRTARRKSGTGR